MKRLFLVLSAVLSLVVMSDTTLAGEAAPKGKTFRVRTKTCIIFDVAEVAGRGGAPATYVISSIIALPTPDSRMGVVLHSWLIGATLTGMTVTKEGWNLVIRASDLAVKPLGVDAPMPPDRLANILRFQLATDFKVAVQGGNLPAGSVMPVISPEGITSGTATVTFAGSDATPITPNTVEQQAAIDAAAAGSAAADKR